MSSPLQSFRPIAESVIFSLASILTLTTTGCEACRQSNNQAAERTNTATAASPLHKAAGAGDLEEVRRLLEAGENVDAKDEQGQTPLHVAAGAGKVKMVQLLLDRGANSSTTDQNGVAPWQAALATVQIAMQEMMAAARTDMDAAPSDHEKVHEKFHEQLTEFSRPYNEIMKSLQWATQRAGGQEALDAALLQRCGPRDVERLVELGANVHARTEYGRTALHKAWCKEDVLFLVRSGLDVNTKDDLGQTPLHTAGFGSVAVMEALISHGADVNARDKRGRTPLHNGMMGVSVFVDPDLAQIKDPDALRAREMARLDLLLRHRADINARDGMGRTIFHQAAFSGDTRLLEDLVARDADINVLDEEQRTPLDHAERVAVSGPRRVEETGAGSLYPSQLRRLERLKANAQWLRDRGAVNGPPQEEEVAVEAPTLFTVTDAEEARKLIDAGADVNARRERGDTAAHIAAAEGRVDVLRLLLERGAGVNARYSSGRTPLHEATEHGHAEAAKMLLDSGADPHPEGSYGFAPLYWTVRNGDLSTVRLLLEKGASIEAAAYHDRTLLRVAAEQGRADVVRLLLSAGADVDAVETGGTTPLHAVARGTVVRLAERPAPPNDLNRDYGEVARLLIEEGAKTDTANGMGRTPLHIAAGAGNSDVVTVLLDHSPNLALRDSYRATPLDAAATRSSLSGIRALSWWRPQPDIRKAVELLLKAGAEIETRDELDSTPLITAAVNCNLEVVEVLLMSGADVSAKCHHGETPLAGARRGLRDQQSMKDRRPADELAERTRRCKETIRLLEKHGAKD